LRPFSVNKFSLSVPVSTDNTKAPVFSIADVAQLGKLRLASLVVFSAALSYLMGAKEASMIQLGWLVLGGFFVTASSNGINQIIERHLDKLMDRTCNRPLPAGRMSVTQAWLISILMGLTGVLILALKMNLLSGILGLAALLLYTLVYTPLKQKTPFAVFVGAFPGAVPPMLGWAAATGEIGIEGLILFSIQFMWQFPHFWAIAWMLDEDYKKAGFTMLPSPGGRDKSTAFQTVVYTLILLPVSLMPLFFNMAGMWSAMVVLAIGVVFLMQAIRLYQTCSMKAAQKLMFGSFLYLPLVQIALLLDKI
jgi:heme o synthase